MSESDFNLGEVNNTDFPLSLNVFSEVKETEHLKVYQNIALTYIKNNNVRGLLLCHGTGLGKTRTATDLVFHYHEMDPNRKIHVLMAKSLEENFKQNITKYGQLVSKDLAIVDKIKFVSINSSNALDKIHVKGDFEDYEKVRESGKNKKKTTREMLRKGLEDIWATFDKSNTSKSLENSLIIVDEAQQLFNGIVNGSKIALGLYDLIMKTKNIKLLFLSGTPMINTPFELVPCFNMLKGDLLFPEERDDFDSLFVDTGLEVVKNKTKFQNRIVGMVSYFGDLYVKNETGTGVIKHPVKVYKVPMSNAQYHRYETAREIEREENNSKFGVKSTGRFSKNESKSTYRINTRLISNFMIPAHAIGEKKSAKTYFKYVDKITVDEFKNLALHSPKFAKVIGAINKHIAFKGIVHSSFKHNEGIECFAKSLEAVGWKEFKYSDVELLEWEMLGTLKSETLKYAIMSGDIDPIERNEILKVYNSPENVYGEIIKIMLVTSVAAVGTDFIGACHIHILDSLWSPSDYDQLYGRIGRVGSLDLLKPDERQLYYYVYLSDYPVGMNPKLIVEETTDIDIYNKSEKKRKIINQFNIMLAESSIDCLALNKLYKSEINCRICKPNNKKMHTHNILEDIKHDDPCEAVEKTKVVVNEIVLDGKKYYYHKKDADNYDFYRYDRQSDAYQLISPVSDIYLRLLHFVVA